MRFTVFGRDAFAIGGNEHVARLSGINVTARKLLPSTPLHRRLCPDLAGLMLLSRLGGSAPRHRRTFPPVSSAGRRGRQSAAPPWPAATARSWAPRSAFVLLGVVANALNHAPGLQQLPVGLCRRSTAHRGHRQRDAHRHAFRTSIDRPPSLHPYTQGGSP
ncbi:hypothetical protein ACRAWF_21300 [Streptomyces sp. L7]